MRDRLQRRDLEILRTLHRLRFATTRELGMFFPSPTAARRRMAQLSQMNMIRSHTRGIEPPLRYQAWRLSAEGIDAVIAAFPDEPVSDGLAERLPDMMLHTIPHREAISRIYLRLLEHAAGPAPHDMDMHAVGARVDALRARAFDLLWQPDGDVKLEIPGTPVGPRAWASHREKQRRGEKSTPPAPSKMVVVPDATLCPQHASVRLFLELDRSTRSLTRIKEAISRYCAYFARFYDDVYKDGRKPALLYVVHSEGRRRGIENLIEEGFGYHRGAVVLETQAPAWLEENLALPRRILTPASRAPSLREAAKDLYGSMLAHRHRLRTQGQDLPPEDLARLRALRAALARSAGHDDAA